MYTTFTFYTESFFGDLIEEGQFERYAGKAGDEIDQMTFGRLENGLPEDEKASVKVQKAVCALAELLYRLDAEERKASDGTGFVAREDGTVVGKQITSVSSGSESVSYTSGQGKSNSLVSAALSDPAARRRLKADTVRTYLSGVKDDKGVLLLYAGL